MPATTSRGCAPRARRSSTRLAARRRLSRRCRPTPRSGILPYTPEQLYELVAGVERYPEFLPWCKAARITRREGDVFYADLVVAFKVFRERFSSKVTLHRPDRRSTSSTSTARSATSTTTGTSSRHRSGGCIIDFYVDFEFRSRILQNLIGLLFNEAVRRMVGAFETRARQLYQPISK